MPLNSHKEFLPCSKDFWRRTAATMNFPPSFPSLMPQPDIGRYRALMKEYKELEPLSRQYLALAAAEEALAEAKELLYSHDAELSAMAAEQKAEAGSGDHPPDRGSPADAAAP